MLSKDFNLIETLEAPKMKYPGIGCNVELGTVTRCYLLPKMATQEGAG